MFAIVVLLVAGSGVGLVRLSLRPLRRVAATATMVTELPLDTEVSLPARVPDDDPRTEVGQVGAAFNRMLQHVESALARRAASETRLRRFAADASHELRTPLSSIRGYAELALRHRGPVPDDVTHALHRVESESARMSDLVDELLLLARLDAGRPLEREPVDLTRLTIEATSDAQVASRSHRWQLELPDEPLTVRGDELRLRQVLEQPAQQRRQAHARRLHHHRGREAATDGSPELASSPDHSPVAVANPATPARRAATAGPAATARPAATAGPAGNSQPPGGSGPGAPPAAVRLSVTDNGQGIPPDLVPELFERFARGDSSRSRAAGSTGLGLAIVKAVVAAHHGTVSVQSHPGQTTFTIVLPAAGVRRRRERSAIRRARRPRHAPVGVIRRARRPRHASVEELSGGTPRARRPHRGSGGHGGAGLGLPGGDAGLGGGLPGQRAPAEQGSADDGAGHEDAGRPPEGGRVPVHGCGGQRQPAARGEARTAPGTGAGRRGSSRSRW